MRLYNTLTRNVEDFKPQKPGEVTLYTCGPTVYDFAQIGNLRTFIFEDTLRRTLKTAGYTVKHTMNITDVGHLTSDADEGEDKSEKGAKREGKTVREVADRYTEAFKADALKLNLLPPNTYHSPRYKDTFARATEFIDTQIDIVQRLLDKGYAYQTKEAIYFDVTKLPDYGKLTGQKLADKEVGARDEVVTDAAKHHPYDFAVWFFTVGRFAGHSMHWSSPWGDGFPGWHLECSAIIHATLGDPIDIHTGGVDHIGTHHTNEIAQTQAAYGNSLANYWIHGEFLLIDGGRMGKSLGNFYTLKDITEHNFSPLAYRLLVLQAHYRTQLNFTWESLEGAQNTLLNLYAWADLRYQPNTGAMTSELDQLFKATRENMLSALQNDLGTPEALSHLSKLVNYMSNHPVPAVEGKYTDGTLAFIDDLLGLNFANRPDITAGQKHLIAQRETARQAKDWAASDQLRDQLRDQHLEVDDTPAGPRWRRTNVMAMDTA
ncbi:MAG: cysteinyl-tRNA synthetase [Patescibacteria group bacterium]|nr:cysteinyl-tRNA synthetase [Patescibacteria group bacterium]